jgi:hypothetical protein
MRHEDRGAGQRPFSQQAAGVVHVAVGDAGERTKINHEETKDTKKEQKKREKQRKSTTKKRRTRRFILFFLRVLRFFVVDFLGRKSDERESKIPSRWINVPHRARPAPV